MTNLVLTRKAGQSVRLLIGDKTEYVEILDVTGGFCKFRLLSTLQVERVRFRDSMQSSISPRRAMFTSCVLN